MKKIGSVNLDKLINDFSQIEKVCKDIKKLWNIGKMKSFCQREQKECTKNE